MGVALKLEKHLVLNKYFLNLFGFNELNELREKLKDTQEGYDSTGRSYFVDVLIGLKPEWEDELLRYDEAIKDYVERLRKNRRQPNFNLKYFQYLAVLFTEIFLNRYYNDKDRFIAELNKFLEKFNNENKTEISPFTEGDLKKLAFWMATGSGKTLIMHINYWQILKYSKNNWDNIILITPNEGLSKQHYEELKLSGIPCKLYDGNIDNLKTKDGEILIIDIHKLTEEKKGEGVSVDVSYFDGKNLVFIDEGHKGAGGESETGWKSLREKVAKNGFIFEYSATFGQIIEFTKSGRPKGGKSNQTNLELYNEYTKAIIFNYSYKYFYTDGYGKDFYVYNIREDAYTETQRDLLLTDLLLTAGLLSFYEQLVVFEKYREELRKYNIEKPLWIFVGSKVTGKGINSDVVKIIQFLDKIVKDENYLKENIKKILEGGSGLIDDEGNDIFKGKFEFIRNLSIDEIVKDVYQKVFGGKGKLELREIKNADGEIGLKIATEKKYFGVVNVGDVRSLKKLIINKLKIEVKEEHLIQSLFFGINESNSHVNILIGSKKFVEGWNSWRVSNMCLINMGKSEGPQIIQLFGRGVRLKGKDYSLKREENPDYILKVLQTLFIFGLNADYINAFLTAIEKEEVDYEEIVIPIRFNKPEEWEGKIYSIKTKEDFDFLEHPVKLGIDENILKNIKIDLRPKITIAHGLKVGSVDTVIGESLDIPYNYFELIHWDSIYSEIVNYKITKGMFNLLIDKKILKQIAESRKYQIFMTDSKGIKIEQNNGRPTLRIESFDGVKKLHDIILMVLKDYILKFYRREEKKETMKHLTIEHLTKEDEDMFPGRKQIILKIPKNLMKDFERLIKQIEEYNKDRTKIPDVLKTDVEEIPTIYFDRHLYVPLVVYKKGKESIKSVPVKLNKGETKFVKDLRAFLNRNKDLLKNNDIFLLRNLPRKGVGFFISSGFYPDFIIWVKNESKQNIIFVDPKGIRNLGNFNDEKIQLCTSYIKEIESRVNEELRGKNEKINLQLDAFILSVSSYDDVKTTFGEGRHSKEEFERHNIIFQEDEDYIKKIFEKVGTKI
ncbi:MAG: DEAD/DEAH box helicase family protein [Candidatus Asgardarchaeia archaeon]